MADREAQGADAAIDAVIAEVEHAGGAAERARLVAELAERDVGVPDARVTELWDRIGAASRALGDAAAAEAAYRRVAAREPLHDAALRALTELAEARGDWRAAIDIRRGQIAALAAVADSAARRARLHEQIGDAWRERLGDAAAAIAAYADGLALVPGARGLLHKRLELHSAQRDWRRALDTLAELAAHEPAAARRARFHHAAAMIARDELGDAALAIDRLEAALDADPRTASAFDALDDLWTERGDARQRARIYRRQIERLGDAAPASELAALWGRLGDLCLALADGDAATAAYQVAADLAPGEPARREQLVELHLAGGDAHRRDAIAELHRLLELDPGRIELYRALATLYGGEGEIDAACCVAQVLVVLGAASDDERRLHARLRARSAPPARRFTDELWRKAIAHPREDRRIGAILAAALPAIAADTAQPPDAFGLAPEARVDLEREPRAIARVLRHACGVLAIEPPRVWFDPGAAGLRIASTLDEQARPVRAVIVGMPELAGGAERALAFAVGKRLAYLRAERLAALLVPALSRLESAFAALVLRADDAPTDPARRSAARLRARLPDAVVDHIEELARGLAWRPGDGALAAWRTATDLTADRVGFVLAGDLETAARAVATEGATLGPSVKDRLRELMGYAASERYFAVRRHLGQQLDGAAVRAPGDAPIAEP